MQLGSLLTPRCRIGEDSESEVVSTFALHPSHAALTNAVDTYLDDVHQLFVRGRARAAESDGTSRIGHAHARLLDYMLYR